MQPYENTHQSAASRSDRRRQKKWRVLINASLLVLAAGLITAGLLAWFVWLPPDAEIRRILSSRQALQQFLLGFGWWAPVIFVLLQTVQVIFSPIPGGVSTLAGGLIFGVWEGFLLSSAGTVLGSLVAFALARLCGQRIVIRLVGQEHFERYSRFWTARSGLSLVIFFLLPFFPDDILCLLAGLSTLPMQIFLLFLIVGRLPSVFLTTLVGAGSLSFSLWEWIIIGVLAVVVLIVFFKYGSLFEQWVQRISRGRRQKREMPDPPGGQ